MNNPLKRLIEFIQTPGHGRTITAFAILIIAAAVPLTVLVAQQQQNTQQHASGEFNQYCGTTYCGISHCSGFTYSSFACPGCVPYSHSNSPSCGYVATPTPKPTVKPTATPTPKPTATPTNQDCQATNPCTYWNGTACVPYTNGCVSPTATPVINPASPTPAAGAGTGVSYAKYCTNGSCSTSTSGGQCVVFSTFSWPVPSNASSNPQYLIKYSLVGSTITYGPYSSGSSTSITTPFGANTTNNGINFSQCPGTDQNHTGYSCGFTQNATVTWYITYVNTTGARQQVNGNSFLTASCSTVSPTPPGQTPAPTPTPSPINNLSAPSNLTANPYCDNHGPDTTHVSYTDFSWGAVTGADHYILVYKNSSDQVTHTYNVKATSLTSPFQVCGTGGTLCVSTACSDSNQSRSYGCGFSPGTVAWSVQAVNAAGLTGPVSNGNPYQTAVCNATPTPTPTPIPTCNGSTQGVGVADCSQAVCIANPANACGVNSGTETCTYNTYNVTETNCNPQNVSNQCDATCSTGTCNNGTCATPTPTPTPSGSASPTPTPAPGSTLLALKIGIDAIGSVGDNENPNPSSSNQNPLHPQRNVEVWIYDSNNNQVSDKIGSINYNSGTGIFTGTVNLGTSFTSGNYTVKVKSDGHLRRLIPGIQNIPSGQTAQMPQVNLVAGDVDGNNAINISDYNILLSCVNDPDVSNIDNHALCNTNPNYVTLSDLDDNGNIDKFDYNLFVREYSVQSGD